MTRILAYVLACIIFASPVAHAAPGDELRFYVITFSPGSAVWELFGHNMLVLDDGRGPPRACNWGMFDFDESGFIPRLMMGRMIYQLGVENGDAMVEAYANQEQRTILRQDLDLTAEEKLRLFQYLADNSKPENRKYRYDYYRDNCSTRVRDAIDFATGGVLSRELKGKPTDSTYRSETRRLTGHTWGWSLALTTVMGHPIDRPIDAFERAFIPSRLAAELDALRLPDGRPLVTARAFVHRSAWRPAEPTLVPFFGWINLAVGVAFGGMIVAAAALARSRKRVGSIALWSLVSLWCVIGGAGSLASAWGWLLTDHFVTRWNENVLVLPLPMLALPLLLGVSMIWNRAARWTHLLAFVMLGATVLAVALKVLPWMRQPNAEVWMLALPIHVALAWAVWRVIPKTSVPDTGDRS